MLFTIPVIYHSVLLEYSENGEGSMAYSDYFQGISIYEANFLINMRTM